MTVGMYRDREPAPFRAVQYDGSNAAEIIAFTKGAARFGHRRLNHTGEDKLLIAEPYIGAELEEIPVGGWVLQITDGDFMQYDEDEFEADFEPA